MLKRAILFFLLCVSNYATGQLMINEIGNGAVGTEQEFIELVVVGPQGSMVDLRGMVIDDNSGFWSCATGFGLSNGHLRFANISNWQCVPTGSIILLYNNNDKHPNITLADDSTDANGDFVYILPTDAAGMFTYQMGNPSLSTCNNFSGIQSPNSNLTWNSIALNDTTDGVNILSPSNLSAPIHQVAYGNAIPAAMRPSIWFNAAGSGSSFFFDNSNSDFWTQRNNWSRTSAIANQSPGFANNTSNGTWIENLRIRVTSSGDTICAPASVAFNPFSSLINVTWEFGDGSLPVMGKFPAPHNYNAGYYWAKYTFQTATGCVYIDSTAILAFSNVIPQVDNDTICGNDTARLVVENVEAYNEYYWWADSTSQIKLRTDTMLSMIGLSSDTCFWYSSLNRLYCGDSTRYKACIGYLASTNVLPSTISDTICLGDSAVLKAYNSGPGALYKWYNAASAGNRVFNGDSMVLKGLTRDTVFFVSTGDSTVCSNDLRIPVRAIVLNPSQAASALGDTVCSGDEAILVGTGLSMVGIYNWYQDSLSATAVYSGDTFRISGLTRDTSFFVAAVAQNNCTDTSRSRITIRVEQTISAPIAYTDSLCRGDSIWLKPMGRIANVDYLWTDDTLALTTIYIGDSILLRNVQRDTLLFLKAISSGECVDTSFVRIDLVLRTITNLPPTVVSDTFCRGEDAVLVASNGGSSNTFSWFDQSTGGALVFIGDTFRLSGLLRDTSFYVSSGDQTNCTNNSRVRINAIFQSPTSSPPLLRDTIICIGENAVVRARGGGSNPIYRWYASMNSQTVLFTGVQITIPNLQRDTTFFVTTGDGTLCDDNTRVRVRIRVSSMLGTIPTAIGDTVCTNESAILRAFSSEPAAVFTWYESRQGTSPLFVGSDLFIPSASQSRYYFVTTGDGSECSNNTRIAVPLKVDDPVDADFTCFPEALQTLKSIRFTYTGSRDFASLTWHFYMNGSLLSQASGEDVYFNPLDTGALTILLISLSDGGCLDTLIRQKAVQPFQPNTLFIPEAFSPNNDGVNDEFAIVGSNIERYSILIFNRWGELIFLSENINKSWDGEVAGVPAPLDTYVYKYKVRFEDGEERTGRGMLYLLK